MDHRPGWLDPSDYDFDPHYLDLPSGRLHYVDEGSGPPVVMVHGNPTWSYTFRHLVKALRPSHRCIAVDHLGFGLSDKPSGWSYRPADHAANLESLIGALELEDVCLVLQDWGGPIGVSYAGRHPDNVSGLILINTWAWPVNRDPHFVLFSQMMGGPLGRLLIRQCNLFVEQVLPRAYGDRAKLTPEIWDHYRRPLATPADRQGCAVLPGQITGSSAFLRELWDQRTAWAQVPALLAWGDRDIAFRAGELHRWEETLRHATTHRFPAAGHFVQEEHPTELAGLVAAFLTARRIESSGRS